MAVMKFKTDEIKGNMTPMIDVVFQLIIFFILLPFKQLEGKIDSELPKDMGFQASRPPPDQPPQDVRIFLKGGGDLPVRVAVHEELLGEIATPPEFWHKLNDDARIKATEAWEDQISALFDRVAEKIGPHLAANPETMVVVDCEPDVPTIYVVKSQDAARIAARAVRPGGTVEINYTAPAPGVAEPERLGVSPIELFGEIRRQRGGS